MNITNYSSWRRSRNLRVIVVLNNCNEIRVEQIKTTSSFVAKVTMENIMDLFCFCHLICITLIYSSSSQSESMISSHLILSLIIISPSKPTLFFSI